METFLKVICVLVLTFGTVGALVYAYSEPVPVLKDGDLIFRTNFGTQSTAVMAATGSKYTHVGVVKNTPQGLAVIDMTKNGQKVILIEKWIDKSFFDRYAVYRYRDLPDRRRIEIINSLYRNREKNYDFFFNFNNKEQYSAEMIYVAYRDAGADIGKTQKIRLLNLDNPFARNLMHQRLAHDPECAKKTVEECKKIIINRDVITPTGLAEDLHMELIYSNYPF